MPTKVRTVPQVPGMHIEHYQFLREIRDAVVQLQASTLPPSDPRNLKVSPFALGNNVQWTRSPNAKRYTLYISNSPSSDAGNPGGSIAVDVGNSNYYNDLVGQANYSRWYWVKAWNGEAGSRTIGPVLGVTLAAGATVNPPTQVSPGVVTVDRGTGQKVTGTTVSSPGHGPNKV